MLRSSLFIYGIALAHLLSAGRAHALQFDAKVKVARTGQKVEMRDDIGSSAKLLNKLSNGAQLVVYPQISSTSHYFAKLKSSAPGEGSGWVDKKYVQILKSQARPTTVAAAKPRVSTALGAPASSTRRMTQSGTKAALRSSAARKAPDVNWDIPSNHWARKAVESLAESGLLRVPDGKFEGGTKVSRYELAVVTQRVVARSSESVEALKAQLAQVNKDGAEARRKLQQLKGRIAEIEKNMNAPQANRTSGAGEDVEKLSKEVDKLRQTFTRAIAGLALDRSKIDDFKSSWSSLLSRMHGLERRIQKLEGPPTS